MDSDFWTSRLAAAKRQYNVQHRHQTSHLDRLSIDDFEVDDEVRPDFPCPYCYEDFDIASLCSHLEDDHPCESKVTICPVCYVKVAGDMLSHITLQHGNLFKLQRRRRLRRLAIPSIQALSLLGRDLREAHLQVLLGGGAHRPSSVNASCATTDSFLSSIIMNFPASETEEITKSVATSFEDTTAKNAAPAHMWKSSFDPSLSNKEREKRIQQATGRAGFVQDLVLTTLLKE
ncbi:protein DEHYDRATION-INDUCED 19 homolog 4-like [Hibiscus syriacus]|uniref:protein DEHYDRATION-INDUCED 19 homolog 4-like n=1 Tax=Hibiscus syriacus TaxID=106335 RepID=UPI00192158F8|nr:protein DEHYDRATION-INDUCED 19 homolog 4-like [Hibiscus syriacus]